MGRYDIVQPNRTYNCWDTIEQQIKQSGSDIFATKEDLEQVKEMLLDDVYPVGMILCASVAPKIGTWEDITASFKGRYLRLDDVGTLTAESLPKPTITLDDAGTHTHTADVASEGGHTHTGSTASAGAHTHTVNGSRSTGYYIPNGSYYGKDETSVQTTSSNGAHTHTMNLDVAGTHTHTVTNSEEGLHNHNLTFSGDVYQEGASVQPLGYGIKIYRRTA